MKNVRPLIAYLECIKTVAERQLLYASTKGDQLLEASYIEDVLNYDDIIEILQGYSNATPLQSNRKKCPGCGEIFAPTNQAQEACSGKCRVRIHRNSNRLKEFNAKVSEILKQKDDEAKFITEQQIVENGKCPFVVTYKGTAYKADNTKNLLCQLRKI